MRITGYFPTPILTHKVSDELADAVERHVVKKVGRLNFKEHQHNDYNDDKIVDWSSVTKSLTDRLDEVEAKRAANRERIEGEIADASQKIGDVPMGNYENMNSFMIQTSTDMAENLRVNSALLRAGKMKSSEFAKFRQNSLDAIGQYKKIAENYNSLRDKGVARLNEGKSGWQEAHELERLEKLADLTRTVSVQDPITGTMFNAPIGEDGRPDMSQAESTLYLANMPFVEMDKFDMNAQLDPTVEKYGENVKVIKSLGINTKSSIKIRKDFEDSVNTFVGSFDSRQLASVLGDFIGGYKGTTDEDLAKSKPEEYILIGRDGSNGNFPTYKLTPEQETKAREAIKEQLYMKLDYVETPMATTSNKAPSSAQISKGRRVDIDKERINDWLKFYTGDDATKERILSANSEEIAKNIGAGNKPIDISVVGNEISVSYEKEYQDGTKKTITKPITIPENDFIGFLSTSGRKLLGDDFIEYLDEALEISDYKGTEKYNPLDVSYKTQVEVEEPKGQDLGGAKGITPLVLIASQELANVSTGFFTSNKDTYSQYEQAVKNALMPLNNYTVSVSDSGVLTVSVEGLGTAPTIQLDQKLETKKTVKNAIAEILKRVDSGQDLGGAAEPPKPAGGAAGDDILGGE